MTQQIAHIASELHQERTTVQRGRWWRHGLATAAAGVAAAAALSFAAPAGAATPAGVTFDTPGEHALALPGYVTSVRITAVGGQGGRSDQSDGGVGARVSATVPVYPGSTIYPVVGGDAPDARQGNTAGGFNGGGAGGSAPLAWRV